MSRVTDPDHKKTILGVITASLWFGASLLKYLSKKQEEKEMKMSEGVKNIQDIIVFGNEFALLLAKKLKDGIQVQDGMDIASALFVDGEVKAAFNAAIADISKVIDEAKDIDAAEGVQLGMLQLSYVPKYIEAFKK
jgi:hypothetical protein